jgi:hypothetical protein
MSVESDFVAAMVGYAPLAALVGTRVVPDKMGQAGARPFLVYVVKRTPTYNLLGELQCTEHAFAAQVWADDRQSADAATDAMVAALAAATTLEAGGVPYDEREVVADHDLDLEGNEVTFTVFRDA